MPLILYLANITGTGKYAIVKRIWEVFLKKHLRLTNCLSMNHTNTTFGRLIKKRTQDDLIFCYYYISLAFLQGFWHHRTMSCFAFPENVRRENLFKKWQISAGAENECIIHQNIPTYMLHRITVLDFGKSILSIFTKKICLFTFSVKWLVKVYIIQLMLG